MALQFNDIFRAGGRSILRLCYRLGRAHRHWLLPLMLIGATAVAALAFVYVPRPLTKRFLTDEMSRKAQLWSRRVMTLLNDGAHAFENAEVSPESARSLLSLQYESDIFRLKLLDAEGRVFWSTRPGDIGSLVSESYFSRRVAAGLTVVKIDEEPPSAGESIFLHASGRHAGEDRMVAEIYAPVIANGKFVGAAEFYSDMTDAYYALIWRMRWLIGALAAGGSLVSASGLAYAIRSSRAREREIAARTERDAEMMANQVRLSREVQLLGELNEWLQSAASLDELFDMVSRFLTHLLPVSEGSIYVYSNSRDVLDGWAAWNGGAVLEHIRPDDCWGLRRGRTYTYGTNEVNFACNHAEPHDGRPYFCFPILAHGETVGLMHLRAAKGEPASKFRESQKLAQMCAEQISMAIANVRMRDQLREQSIRDPLTGLFNRRHMAETLRACIERARSSGHELALLSLDVDHFKTFNDNHGHDAGDMVLRAVAGVLSQVPERNAVACRPGGEEFALIMPDTNSQTALARAEAIRAAVEELRVRYGNKDLPKISVSIGVATCPTDGVLVRDLLKSADDALYAAKDGGRNRVVAASAHEESPPRQASHKPDDQGDSRQQTGADAARSGAKGRGNSPQGSGATGKRAKPETAPRANGAALAQVRKTRAAPATNTGRCEPPSSAQR